MRGLRAFAWALMLGLALTSAGLVGLAGAFVGSGEAVEPVTQEAQMCRGGDLVGLGLAMRWGYLDDPVRGRVGGRWAFGDDRGSGAFRGRWYSEVGRIDGTVQGRWSLGDDGRGAFEGRWQDSDGSPNGSVRGIWARHGDRAAGFFDGMWTLGDRPGGAVRGEWSASERDPSSGGEFRGIWVHAPSLDMVPWDGFVETTDGGVRLLQVVRFERGGDYRMGMDDRVYDQDNRLTIEWRSSTVTNWDGLIVLVVAPRERPMPHVTVHTDQASFVFEASEIPGLHLREPVDRAGHEIEIRGFAADIDRCERHAGLRFVARWGYLPERNDTRGDPTGDLARWDGSLSITRGGIGIHTVLDWERGEDEIVPRDDRHAVEWRSSTTDDWDGIAFGIVFPLDRPEPNVTLIAGPWTHTWALHELFGFHARYPVDDVGHEIEVVSVRA